VVLVYCGFIGGSGLDYGDGIAVDGSGNAYVTGFTHSDEATFPVTVGPDLTYNGGFGDAFVAKVSADGKELVYCGYIGGSGDDFGTDIAVDGSGNAYVTGRAESDERTFPVTVGPDLTYNGGGDAFVAKVNAAGTGLVYCGFIGGRGTDYGYGIAVDGSGNAYVTGWTESNETTFPVTVGPDLTYNGAGDAFVAKVDASGTGLVYCGYIGGSSIVEGWGIAVDGSGNAYVTGRTSSDEKTFPVTVGPDLMHNGKRDAFVAKVNTAGTGLVYCGYIGGVKGDWGKGIAVDGSGNTYVTGGTASNEKTFPVAVRPDLTYNGGGDAFVAKVDASGTGLVYCGYIGGEKNDEGAGIAVDGLGNAYVTGLANCNLWDDEGEYIEEDGSGNDYVTGTVNSDETSFPVTVGPDLTHSGEGDAFLAKIGAVALHTDVARMSDDGFRILCAEGTAAEVQAAIEAGADVKGKKGEPTPLHWAGLNPKPGVILALLKAGADVNARSANGDTPLHRAAANNSAAEVVSLLLKAGANANTRNRDGRTPLHLAAQGNPNPVVTELLLKAGADAKAKDTSGMRPIDYAEKNPSLRDTEAYWTLNDASY